MTATSPPEPALHDLVTVLRAPSVLLSAGDGQLRPGGVAGFYRDDRRVLSRLEVTVADIEPLTVGHHLDGSARATFLAVVPGLALGVEHEGPTVYLERTRELTDDQLVEALDLVNSSGQLLQVRVRLVTATDLASVATIRSGTCPAPVAPTVGDRQVNWRQGDFSALLTVDREPSRTGVEDDAAVLEWNATVPAGERWRLTVTVTTDFPRAAGYCPVRPARPVTFTLPENDDTLEPAAARLLRRSLEDLDGLLLADSGPDGPVFLAAGSPWYFTLFGRDSLWAARMLLPLGHELAEGTLQALASRQGRRHDPVTEEQPGKIPHEVRRDDMTWSAGLSLPPLYYGTIDATALWVCLLHEAWRAGLPADRVTRFLPHLQAALGWITEHGDADGDGFVEYVGSQSGGLANQGWKDSTGGVCWADGRFAEAPLALCEVQGYAYQAAIDGAELLDSFDQPGADRYREWAAGLRERFRARFWVEDESGRYPAIALDGRKEPVTGATSNMGHLLGTGLLDPEEAATVAARLAQPDLTSGYGLRTLSTRSRGYNPFSYHRGSIWPHDTAIAMLGLAAEGHHEQARDLAAQLIRVGEHFGHRMPELYAGTDPRHGEPVAAYPAACAPQAWSAAAGVAAVAVLAGWPHPLATPKNGRIG
ncbi:MAG TPA: glycogen debranching N-terminal domain-containing protein [Pseudonocardiaceae bacterium]